jgi:hypothetical protein
MLQLIKINIHITTEDFPPNKEREVGLTRSILH